MPSDEMAIACSDEIGFDVIRAHLNGELIRLECVLGSITRGATMGDDERRGNGVHHMSRQRTGDEQRIFAHARRLLSPYDESMTSQVGCPSIKVRQAILW